MRCIIPFVALLTITIADPATAQTPSLVVSLPDTVLSPDESAWLSVYMVNYDDYIAGVQFTIVTRDVDVVSCDLSGPRFDTTGTLLSGWELVDGYDNSGTGASLTLYGLANTLPDNGIYEPPIPPYSGGELRPLIRFPVRTGVDILSEQATAALEFEGWLEFSTPDAHLVGIVTELEVDTLYLVCLERNEDSCLTWEEVDPHVSPYDTVVVDSSLSGYIDSTVVVGRAGSVTVEPAIACDITLDGRVTLTDLTCLVQILFNQNEPSHCLYYGNCNFADPAMLNLSDLTGLVNFLFLGGPPPH